MQRVFWGAAVGGVLVQASTLHAGPGPQWGDCNGNGIKYVDTETCECFQCWAGGDCTEFLGDKCVLDDVPGNPLVNQEYWAFHPSANDTATTTVSNAMFRSGYARVANLWSPGEVEDEGTGLGPAVGDVIRQLHKTVGNVQTDDYYIVPGSGGTQMIGAAIYALQRTSGSSDVMSVYAKAPYYGGYTQNAEVIKGVRFCNLQSANDVSVVAGCVHDDYTPVTDQKNIIEFVTLPNNPDNEYREAVYPNSRIVYDMAYNWPSLITDNTPTKNFAGDIMLFTLSKLSGHAGTRFGWALVKDKAVATSMATYVAKTSQEVSHDALHRTYRILRHIADPRNEYFSHMRRVMEQRRDDLQNVFANMTSFTQISKPDAASFYVWLKCVACDSNHESAASLFKRKTGIAVSGGGDFGYPPSYVRLHVVLRSHTWELFIARLGRLD